MSRYLDEQDEVVFSEPIMAQKGVRLTIGFVERADWEIKEKKEWNADQLIAMQPYVGKKYEALKLTLTITDESVRTERPDAKPKITIEDQFNIVRFPYPSKKTGQLEWMSRQKLYQLETAFGFDPIFMQNGQRIEPHITKTGSKVAPKGEGVTRQINPDFFTAYFQIIDDGSGKEKAIPVLDNWIGKVIYADVELEQNERYGDKNVIGRYVKAPNA